MNSEKTVLFLKIKIHIDEENTIELGEVKLRVGKTKIPKTYVQGKPSLTPGEKSYENRVKCLNLLCTDMNKSQVAKAVGIGKSCIDQIINKELRRAEGKHYKNELGVDIDILRKKQRKYRG